MNKKTIGVYGDSFANYENYDYLGKSWVELLEREYTVTNFGHPGNSMYQCYKTILSNHEQYDYNIFLIPSAGRFFSKRLDSLLDKSTTPFNNWYNNLPSIEAAKLMINNNKKSYDNADRILKIIDSVHTYWTEWKDSEFDEAMNNLMIDNIKKFNNSLLINTHTINNNLGLIDISMWELDQLGFSEKYPNHFGTINETKSLSLRDSRKNHLSEENNFKLYEKILDAINSNLDVTLSLNDFVKPSKDIEYYVRWQNI